jgi:hypothetical protein
MVKLEATDVDKNKNAFSNQEGIFIFFTIKNTLEHRYYTKKTPM